MEKARLGISRHPSLTGKFLFVVFLLSLCSCSMPRLVVLRDTLSASEHNDLGVIYEKKGILDLAEKEYLKAAYKEKKWSLPLFNLGNLFYIKGDLVTAEQYYRNALALDSRNADIMNNLACLLHDLRSDTEAMELINRALCMERKSEYLDTYNKISGSLPGEDDEAEDRQQN